MLIPWHHWAPNKVGSHVQGANPFFTPRVLLCWDTWDENKIKRLVENSFIWGPTPPNFQWLAWHGDASGTQAALLLGQEPRQCLLPTRRRGTDHCRVFLYSFPKKLLRLILLLIFAVAINSIITKSYSRWNDCSTSASTVQLAYAKSFASPAAHKQFILEH